jgi:ferredoxin-type protein NapH
MRTGQRYPGADAIAAKGWWLAHRWLIARRMTQFGILALFLAGPLAGIWILEGNISSSTVFDIVPMTDPLVALQSLAAGHLPELTALGGAIIVALFYVLVGGRAYCAWVCPVNIVTDAAQALRRRLGLKGGARLAPATRYWLLAAALLVSAATGVIAWELINPVSMTYRGLLFGMGAAWFVLLAVFVLDLAVTERGWCGHLCPVGAFYSILGKASVTRIAATNRQRCNDCSDCLKVCPEPQVLKLPLYGAEKGASPVISSPNCTNCGRCIDVCSEDVFRFTTRFAEARQPYSKLAEETQS